LNSISRRGFLQAAAATSAGVALTAAPLQQLWAREAKAALAVTPLSTGLWMISGAGGNVVLKAGTEGALLVDGGNAANSSALLKLALKTADAKKVHTLFNTHWHPDQTGSNQRAGKQGARIIAQENTRLWLATDVTWPWNGQTFKRLPKIAQPNKTFYTNGKLESGIQYGYVSDAAHTDGDLYAYFPQQNVLAVGDVVSNQGWPQVDWVTGGWIAGIVGGLQRISTIGNENTIIVPGRGPVMTMADLKTHYDMYGAIYDRLSKLLNSGRGPTEAVDAKPAKEFEAKMGNPDEFVRRAFESLWAYVTPDA